MLDGSADPAGMVLVTSDRALADRARHRGVRNVVTALRFRRTLDDLAPAGADAMKALSPEEVADWEAWFRGGAD